MGTAEKTIRRVNNPIVRARRTDAHCQVLIVAGETDRLEYPLIKQVDAIGSRDGAVIRLTGWFAAKSAATIARRGHSYSISPFQNAKSLLVNGTDVVGQQDLKDGDQIEVAGVKLTFCVISETKNTTRERLPDYLKKNVPFGKVW